MKKALRIFVCAVLSLPLMVPLFAIFNEGAVFAVSPPLMRVGISLTANHVTLTLESGDSLTNQASGATITLMPGTYSLENNGEAIRISDAAGKSCGAFTGPLQLVPAQGTFKLGNSRYSSSYRGSLEILRRGTVGLTAVNIVDIESYLRGVVPREMPSSWGNYGGLEALKAQAVASRTYALNNLAGGNHRNDPFVLCDSQHCQLYGGIDGETAITDRAVLESRGHILTWNGKPIEAYFHSNNGGYTECSGNVWMTSFPYLISQPDPFDVPENPNLLSHPHALWEKEVPVKILNNLLLGGGASTTVQEVRIASVFPSERVNELHVSGGGKTVSFLKERARTVLGLRSQLYSVRDVPAYRVWVASADKAGRVNNISMTELEGKWAVSAHGVKRMLMEERYAALAAGGRDTVPYPAYIFEGRGWGHGIGMSQYGAYNRSRAGHSYAEILSFYYSGTQLLNAY